MASEALSQRPYLLRAMHEWMSDSGLTPHIVVDATVAGVQVPEQHVDNGKIVLNISYSAARDLELSNDSVAFEARFSGTPFSLFVPIAAVLAIYARESGTGLVFTEREGAKSEASAADAQSDGANERPSAVAASESTADHPHLRVIK